MSEEWIKCSERMPETEKDVLVASKEEVGIGKPYQVKGKTYWSPPSTVSGVDSELDFIGEITHWRELPEPPKIMTENRLSPEQVRDDIDRIQEAYKEEIDEIKLRTRCLQEEAKILLDAAEKNKSLPQYLIHHLRYVLRD